MHNSAEPLGPERSPTNEIIMIVSCLGVYYQREAIMKTLGRSQKPPAESNAVVEEPKQKGRIREME